MDKKLIKNIIIICIVLFVIIIISLVVGNKKQDKVNIQEQGTNVIIQSTNVGLQTNDNEIMEFEANCILQEENNKSSMFFLENLTENYINFVNSNNEEAIQELTDSTYNASDLILGNSLSKFKINEIYLTANEKQSIYYISGNYLTIDNLNVIKEPGRFKITLDIVNNTYKIKAIGEEEYNNKSAIKKDTYLEITTGIYNNYEYKQIDTKTYINEYFQEFIYFAKNAPQYAFDNLLDSSYRDLKFIDVYSFIEYINNLDIDINSVDTKNYDTYTEYKAYDKENNEYILKEYAKFEYKILLDNYTVVSAQEAERYKTFSEEEKVSYCVNNFLEKLNNQDYKSAYAVLPKGYKNTNFPTLQSFEEYVKSNFYEKNIFSQAKVTAQDGVYVAEVTIKSGVSTKAQKQEKVFYVQLNDNMSYVLSFQY